MQYFVFYITYPHYETKATCRELVSIIARTEEDAVAMLEDAYDRIMYYEVMEQGEYFPKEKVDGK